MSYRDNWLRHLLAPLTGDGLSNALARDFWSGEDLWDPKQPIQLRWMKLVWVYSVSALAQVTLPSFVAGAVISTFKPIPFRWWMISVGGASLLGLVFALVVATVAYIDIARKSKNIRLQQSGMNHD